MNIWIVEDDYLQCDMLSSQLHKELGSDIKLCVIATEHEFREKMASLKTPYPNIVMLDIMLRWADPAPDMPPPPEELQKEGYRRAGFRCERLIRENSSTKNIPVFLYSVLDEIDVEDCLKKVSEKTKYIGKNANYELLSDLKGLCGLHRK